VLHQLLLRDLLLSQHRLLHQHQQLLLCLRRKAMLLLKPLRPMLRLRLPQPQCPLFLVLRNHLVWVHLVVQFRRLRAVVVQFRHHLVVQVERQVLVVRQWVVVLLARVLVLALVVFLQVHWVAVL
jgi:hypothetical protein